jgi:hypothetical protein
MQMGDEVRVSTPVSTASCIAKPLIFLSKAGIASLMAATANAGSAGARSQGVKPGW